MEFLSKLKMRPNSCHLSTTVQIHSIVADARRV